LPGEGEIFFGDSSFIMRGELQRDFVKANINIRMVFQFLGLLGDSTHKSDAHQEPLKLKCAVKGMSLLRPIRDGFQVKADFIGVQGWHNLKLIFSSPGTVFLPPPVSL
jgi:hypothetical protein